MVDGEVVFAIDNRARLDCPHCVANRDVRRVNIDVCGIFPLGCSEELRVGVEHAFHRVEGVVFEVERGDEVVVGGVGFECQAQLLSAVGNAADGGVCAQCVVGGGDVECGVAILAVVVDEVGQTGFEVELVVAVVDDSFYAHRLAQCERDSEEVVEPFAVGDVRADAEIVAGRRAILRQSRQSREFAAHKVRKALGERLVVVLSFDLDIGKIALEAQIVAVVGVRGTHIQPVESKMAVARHHLKILDIDLADGIVEPFSSDVGRQVELEVRIAPIVAQMERRRLELADFGVEVGHEVLRCDFSHGRKLCVGVIDIDFSIENAVLEVAVEFNVFVRIILEIEARNRAFRLEREGRCSRRKLPIDGDVRRQFAEFVVVEDALQVQAVAFQISIEIPSVFHEIQLRVASVGLQRACRREVLRRSASLSLKRNVS